MLTYNTNSNTGPVCGGRALINKILEYNAKYHYTKGIS
jgi:hypothetical protein